MAVSPAPDTPAGPDGGDRPASDQSAGAHHITPPVGLTDAEVAERVGRGLTNDAGQRTSRPLIEIIRANVLTPFNALLGGLALIVVATGAIGDALFGLVLVGNSLVGIVQELRAKRTLDQLAVLNAPRVWVIRGGHEVEIGVKEVVLDDAVVVRAGDQVPADGRLREVEGLEVDESLLTGESEPVAKQSGDLVLSGSIAVAGSGRYQVTALGADSFASQLTAEARRFTVTHSELVDGINRILKMVAIAIAVVGPILLLNQTRTTATWQEAVRGAVAGLVGMVPEGLVLLTSVTFFAGALSLARRRVLVRELPAVEGLARVDLLCLDKTGTLTEGDIVFAGLEPLEPLVSSANDLEQVLAALPAGQDANGTMLALRAAFPADPQWARLASVPFSSARKWSAASFPNGTWVLGAPEVLLESAGRPEPARQRANALAASGVRTLLVARTDAALDADVLPPRLVPTALLTFEERVRADAADTLRYFAAQQVAIKVISGDNPVTVAAVARRVGLSNVGEPVDARSLPEDPAKFAEVVDAGIVFGRVTPQQKRAMVAALQSRGHVVAMTGDGVNDALALKDADIGIAMGSGAAATRAVAQLVLLDGQFSVMPRVVAEGRRVIANVERVAKLFLTKNVSSCLLALSVAVARWPFPFLPRHLTLVSGVAIGIPGFFLAIGPGGERFLPGFVRRVLGFALPAGVIASIAVLITYGLARTAHGSPDQARTAATMVFLTTSLWILVILARPFRAWKAALAAMMAGLGLLAFALPVGRRLYQLRLPSSPVVVEAMALGAGAAFLLELASRLVLRVRRPVPPSRPGG